jgi:hypothetical protein
MILAGGGGGYDYSCAPSVSAAHSRKVIQNEIDYYNCDDEGLVFYYLQRDGFAFYKGTPVFQVNLDGDGGGASFGIIVLDDYYQGNEYGIKTLNHEYGHILHMRDVGPVTYFFTTAIPSLTFAGLKSAGIIDVHYHSLPWEYTADRYGNVNWGGYQDWADWQGALFWIYTIVVSNATGGI